MILFIWIVAGVSLDVLIANMVAPVNASSRVEPHFLTVAVFASLAHCIYLSVRDRRFYFRLVLPSFLVAFITVCIYVDDYVVESNCVIDAEESLVLAKNFVKELGWGERILAKEPTKLRGCEFGFEYNSPERYRLVIVTQTGSVRLND